MTTKTAPETKRIYGSPDSGKSAAHFPEHDPMFMELVRQLETCQTDHADKDCQKFCLNYRRCERLFDHLSELCSDRPLTESELIEFQQRFQQLTRQTTLF